MSDAQTSRILIGYMSNVDMFADSLIVKFGWRDDDKDRHRLSFTLIPIIIAIALSVVPHPSGYAVMSQKKAPL